MIKVRIRKDDYCGFEFQIKRWYWPFWYQPYSNTSFSIDNSTKDAINWYNSCRKSKILKEFLLG